MKVRFLFIVVGFVMGFALPILAQEKEEVKALPFTPIPAGPQLVQQIEAINQQFDEAFNKHDAAAVAALYTANAVQTTPGGSFSGREAIQGYIADLFQRHHPTDRVTKMTYVYAFGGDLCALGGWTVTIDNSQKFGGYLQLSTLLSVVPGRSVPQCLSIPHREQWLLRRPLCSLRLCNSDLTLICSMAGTGSVSTNPPRPSDGLLYCSKA